MQISGRTINISHALEGLGIDTDQVINDNVIARCPWPAGHSSGDVNPSFSVSLESGSWICYAGCGGGPLNLLVRRLRGITELEAERWLILEAGTSISFDRVRAAMPSLVQRFEPVYASPEALAKAEYDLASTDQMSEYFLSRGFTWRTIDGWGVRYDAKLRAVVIPVHDIEGGLVGTIKRLVPPVPTGLPRYLYNQGFNRSLHLFGGCRHPRNGLPVIVVEGSLDAMWCWQHGYHAVALMGSYCSRDQARLLQRLSGEVILALDNDGPGREAQAKMSRMLQGRMVVRVVPEYEGKDLQDLSGEQLGEVLDRATYAWLARKDILGV